MNLAMCSLTQEIKKKGKQASTLIKYSLWFEIVYRELKTFLLDILAYFSNYKVGKLLNLKAQPKTVRLMKTCFNQDNTE